MIYNLHSWLYMAFTHHLHLQQCWLGRGFFLEELFGFRRSFVQGKASFSSLM